MMRGLCSQEQATTAGVSRLEKAWRSRFLLSLRPLGTGIRKLCRGQIISQTAVVQSLRNMTEEGQELVPRCTRSTPHDGVTAKTMGFCLTPEPPSLLSITGSPRTSYIKAGPTWIFGTGEDTLCRGLRKPASACLFHGRYLVVA